MYNKGEPVLMSEKVVKTLKMSVKRLGDQLGDITSELSGLRKKERVYDLQKRCLKDAHIKLNMLTKKSP